MSSTEPTPSFLSRHGPAAFAAAATFALYLRTLAPTVTGEDSGELIAAAYTLGIPHPTGYPTWCLLANAFMNAIPFGEVAWRVNLMSAVFGAATVYVVALLIAECTRGSAKVWAAAASAMALACSFEFWEQSIIAEVYTLNAFVFAMCILMLLRWQKTNSWPLMLAAGVLYGLGLGLHGIMYLVGPVFAAFIVVIDRRRDRDASGLPKLSARRYAALVAAVIAGWCVYLYLPIRSLANPPMDWGNPESLNAFWDVVTRKQYTHIYARHERSLALFVQQSRVFLELYLQQFTPWLGWLAIPGAFVAWRRNPRAAALLSSLALVTALAPILIPNFSIERQEIWINTTYWIPFYCLAAIFIGCALDSALAVFKQPIRVHVAGAAILAICAALPLATHWRHNNRADDYLVADFANNILESLDENAIIFATADHEIFPLMYLQIVEGKRPDVSLGKRYGYPDPALYAEIPQDTLEHIGRYPSTDAVRYIEQWIVEHSGRPVYFTQTRPASMLAGRRLENAGLLYRVVLPDEAIDSDALWPRYSWRRLEDTAAPGDYSNHLILAQYRLARARRYWDEQRNQEALAELNRALTYAGDVKEFVNNAGIECARYGEYKTAARLFQRAIDLDPQFQTAIQNLERAQGRD